MASSTTFSSLTNDILIEIFIHLPLTSIYTSKSVSKVWLSILSDPDFITKWFQINRNSLPWIQYHTHTTHYLDLHASKFRNAYPDSHSQLISTKDYGFSFEFLVNEGLLRRDELYLLSSSNGLVLCFAWTGRGRYHVCNPLTQKWVSLPLPPRYSASVYEYSGIFCENSLSSSCCYKVISIPLFGTSKKFNVDMFDSNLGEWRSFEVSCDQDISSGLYKSVITHDGALFLLERNDKMVVYDLNQNNGSNGHRCKLINMPGPRFTYYDFDEIEIVNSRTLGESEGRICYARAGVTRRQITVSVWMLDEDNWQVLHKDVIVHDTLAEICFRTCDNGSIQVSGFSPENRNVVLLGCEPWLWWYNIQTRCFEELGHSSLLANKDTGKTYESFVLKTMPTILPPPSWTDEDDDSRFLPPKYIPSDMLDVFSVAELFSSEQDLRGIDDEDDEYTWNRIRMLD